MRRIEDKNKQELEEYIQNAEMQKSNLNKNLDLAKERLRKIEEENNVCLDPFRGFSPFNATANRVDLSATNPFKCELYITLYDYRKVLYLLNLGKLYYQLRTSQTDHKEFNELVTRINQLVGEMIEKGIEA